MKANSLIVGVMTWGLWGKMLTDAQMAQQIEQTLALGLNRFDNADIYGDYTTEAQFGAALKQSGVDREKLQLITKCGIQMIKGRNNKVKHYQYDASYIVWSAEQSLRNLQTDYIDVFLLHRPSPLMHGEEIGTAVAQLLERGLIKTFGLSNFLPPSSRLYFGIRPGRGESGAVFDHPYRSNVRRNVRTNSKNEY